MMYDIMSYNGTLEQQVGAQVGQHIFVAKEKQFGKNEVHHHGEDFPRNTLSAQFDFNTFFKVKSCPKFVQGGGGPAQINFDTFFRRKEN